jgi:hypothetical protein
VHGFRRTFNNLMRQVSEDKVVLRSMTGHATEEMTEHYSHVGLREKHAAVAELMRLVPTFRADQRDRSGGLWWGRAAFDSGRRALTLRNSWSGWPDSNQRHLAPKACSACHGLSRYVSVVR